jgi:preprotein translocase subunit SecA
MLINIEDLVTLDRYALDVEASQSAANLQTYSKELAQKRADRDSASLAVDVMRAEVSLKVRSSDPQTYGLSKFTEDSIGAIVETDKEVLEVQTNLLKAKEQVYLYEAAVNALNDKSGQIKNLVSLWCGGYYAEPSDNKKLAMGRKE